MLREAEHSRSRRIPIALVPLCTRGISLFGAAVRIPFRASAAQNRIGILRLHLPRAKRETNSAQDDSLVGYDLLGPVDLFPTKRPSGRLGLPRKSRELLDALLVVC